MSDLENEMSFGVLFGRVLPEINKYKNSSIGNTPTTYIGLIRSNGNEPMVAIEAFPKVSPKSRANRIPRWRRSSFRLLPNINTVVSRFSEPCPPTQKGPLNRDRIIPIIWFDYFCRQQNCPVNRVNLLYQSSLNRDTTVLLNISI